MHANVHLCIALCSMWDPVGGNERNHAFLQAPRGCARVCLQAKRTCQESQARCKAGTVREAQRELQEKEVKAKEKATRSLDFQWAWPHTQGWSCGGGGRGPPTEATSGSSQGDFPSYKLAPFKGTGNGYFCLFSISVYVFEQEYYGTRGIHNAEDITKQILLKSTIVVQ